MFWPACGPDQICRSSTWPISPDEACLEAYHCRGAALEVARDEGTERVYVQADHANVAAQSLYARAGFARHHEYGYFRPAGIP